MLCRVSRWAPDARARLETAAFELFAEHGYEATTVEQIAHRAGLNRATFFRHFADKREVLFGGEDLLVDLLSDGIRAAPPGAALSEVLHTAFASADVALTSAQRVKAVQRVRVLAANVDVQERGLLKHSRTARAIGTALQSRGEDEVGARLGAEIAMLAFSLAVERWTRAATDEPFSAHAASALRDLESRLADLTAQPVRRPHPDRVRAR